MGYLYILKCNDGSYYTGSSINLDKRINQHKDGEGAQYTKTRLPVELVYFEEYQNISEAFLERSKFKVGLEKRRKL